MQSMEKHERLRQARIEAGYGSAADAARRMNIPYGTYSGHENGLRGIKDEELKTYARVFRRSMAWLAFGEEQDLGTVNVPIIGAIRDGGFVTGRENPVFDRLDHVPATIPFVVPSDVRAYFVEAVGFEPGLSCLDVVLVKPRLISWPYDKFFDDKTVICGVERDFTLNVDASSYFCKLALGNKEGTYSLILPDMNFIMGAKLLWIDEILAIIPFGQLTHIAIENAAEFKRIKERRALRKRKF